MAIYLMKMQLWFSDPIETVSKRRWRITEGDTLLFIAGSGEEMRFAGTSTVLEVEQKVTEDSDNQKSIVRMYRTTVKVNEVEELPLDRTLGALMFSLIRVTNFSRPYLHFRDRSRLEETDLQTIVTGNVDWNRSLFFGLLRHLPPEWRLYLENSAVAAAASRERSAVLNEYPADELLSIIESTILQPLSLASDLSPVFQSVIRRMDMPNAALEGAPGEEDVNLSRRTAPWNISRLLRIAPEKVEEIRPLWNMVEELSGGQYDENIGNGRRNKRIWRPHRW